MSSDYVNASDGLLNASDGLLKASDGLLNASGVYAKRSQRATLTLRVNNINVPSVI